jgi:hypothetical protein
VKKKKEEEKEKEEVEVEKEEEFQYSKKECKYPKLELGRKFSFGVSFQGVESIAYMPRGRCHLSNS